MKTIRDTDFKPEWIDLGPDIPVPRIDWINRKIMNIPYGEDPLQQIDLYFPNKGIGPYPLVILVHGGGFMLGDKRDWHLYPGFHALTKGYAVASVNYRLTPDSPYPAAIKDVKNAIAHLHAHAGEFELNNNKIYLYGTSAGGNLVSIAGLDDRDHMIKAVAALCPAIDFIGEQSYVESIDPKNPIRQMLDSVFIPYLGAKPTQVPERARQAGVISHIRDNPPPFYIQHGTRDSAVPVNQSYELADALQVAGGRVKLDILQDIEHAGAGPEFLEKDHVFPILAFFESCTDRTSEGDIT